MSRHSRQEPAAADIGKQADPGLRHGIGGALGRHSISRRGRQTHAATHGHAVHDHQNGLGVFENQVIESILNEEEFPRRRAVPRPALGEHPDVAARTEPAFSGMVD